MANDFKRKRIGQVDGRTKQANGEYTKEKFGAVLTDRFQGRYGLIIECETGELDDRGYPIRARLVAGKFATQDGTEIKKDLSNTYFGFTLYEDAPARPPRED